MLILSSKAVPSSDLSMSEAANIAEVMVEGYGFPLIL